ncbi:MAG: hypothetical protein QNJ97_23735 [Myxococcota bacterium]|nr:hypothetical protein [Myxococcota bacterium]
MSSLAFARTGYEPQKKMGYALERELEESAQLDEENGDKSK